MLLFYLLNHIAFRMEKFLPLCTGLDRQKFQIKIVNIFLPITLSICFGCSKEPSHWDVLLSTHNICFGWEIRKFILLLRTALCMQWYGLEIYEFSKCILIRACMVITVSLFVCSFVCPSHTNIIIENFHLHLFTFYEPAHEFSTYHRGAEKL